MLSKESIVVVMPVFDDWESLSLLLPKLDQAMGKSSINPEVLIVDDGSSVSFQEANFRLQNLKYINSVSVLELRRNLGHQRAITLGLAYVAAESDCVAVLVMDGDGEDDPLDAVRLIEKCRAENFSKMIFARRSKRSEGFVFKFFYGIYKPLYRILTGRRLRFGNFSVIPRKILKRLVVVSEVWNHFAVGSMKARVPYIEMNTNRSRRLAGQPKMNFVSLITHGLSAISVYGDVVGVRFLIGTCALIVLSIIGIMLVVAIRLDTNLAIPGWATYVVAMLVIILMQAVTLSLFFIFLVLNGRDSASFVPERDFRYFVSAIHEIYVKECQTSLT